MTYHQVQMLWMGASKRGRFLFLLWCKAEPMILSFPPFSSPTRWPLYPFWFAIPHHYHAAPLYCSSFVFGLLFGRKILCFYPLLVAKSTLIFVTKILPHDVVVPISPSLPHLFFPYSAQNLHISSQPTLPAWHPTWL